MNKLNILLLAAALFPALSADEFRAAKPWHETAKGTYSINYPGKGWPMLERTLELKPETFYRVTLEARSEGGTPACNLIFRRGDGVTVFNSIIPTSDWSRQTFWFYSRNAKTAKLQCTFDPKGGAGKIAVRDIRTEEVSDPASGNVMPDADFEQNTAPLFWRAHRKGTVAPVLAESGDFLTGVRSLQFTSSGNSGIISGKIPVIPGKTYRLSFWAKASVPAGLTAEFSLWDPAGNHKPQHFHSGAQVKIDSGWKKYEVSIPVPSDAGTYPDLAERMGSITFGTWNGPEVQFLIDDVSFLAP